MQRYIVSHYTPGYLPDDPSHVSDPLPIREAIRVWRDDIRYALDSMEDDGAFLEIDTLMHLTSDAEFENDLKRGGSIYVDVEGYRYAIERTAE